MSNETIAVLEYLCTKFGIVIDWSDENIVPYIKDLATRYCSYKGQWSFAWMTFSVIVIFLLLIIFSILIKKLKNMDDKLELTFIMVILLVVVVIFLVIGLSIFFCNLDVYLKCKSVPELVLYDYIQIFKN